MIKLPMLLKDLEYTANSDLEGILIKGLKCDSRLVNRGDLFVAIEGSECDGHDFIDDVAKGGASAVVVCRQTAAAICRTPHVYVKDTRKALAILARNFYKDPSRKLKVIGITGTNGKTTVSYLVESILSQVARGVGRIGTIEYKIKGKLLESINTTPSSLMLNCLMAEMVEKAMDYAVMEVSSHALAQHRTDGIAFSTAVFTNISPEHLDYHKNFQNYLDTKAKLFSGLAPNAGAVLNAEDSHFKNIKKAVSTKNLLSFGIKEPADIRALNLKMGMDKTSFVIDTPIGKIPITTSLIGNFNVSNILAATGAAVMERINPDAIKKGIESLKDIPGRLQPVRNKRSLRIFVDFAHTDDALGKALDTLSAVKQERLIVLFGCGGQRDRLKRPRMGRVASEIADYVIITSDNPRNEDPEFIAGEIKKGLKTNFRDYEIILDRKKAIERAISTASSGDIVLIAGKGHEKYQIIGDRKIPFSDEEVINEILGKRV